MGKKVNRVQVSIKELRAPKKNTKMKEKGEGGNRSKNENVAPRRSDLWQATELSLGPSESILRDGSTGW
jgi:hypothetical protein